MNQRMNQRMNQQQTSIQNQLYILYITALSLSHPSFIQFPSNNLPSSSSSSSSSLGSSSSSASLSSSTSTRGSPSVPHSLLLVPTHHRSAHAVFFVLHRHPHAAPIAPTTSLRSPRFRALRAPRGSLHTLLLDYHAVHFPRFQLLEQTLLVLR